MSQVGVAVTRPGGEISYFTMAEASRTAWLAATGRIVASQQATAVAESYRYVNGRSNQSLGIFGFINKGDQKGRYDTMDTGDQNSQPFLLQPTFKNTAVENKTSAKKEVRLVDQRRIVVFKLIIAAP